MELSFPQTHTLGCVCVYLCLCARPWSGVARAKGCIFYIMSFLYLSFLTKEAEGSTSTSTPLLSVTSLSVRHAQKKTHTHACMSSCLKPHLICAFVSLKLSENTGRIRIRITRRCLCSLMLASHFLSQSASRR